MHDLERRDSPAARESGRGSERDRGLTAIAIFKLVKAVLLVVIGLGAIRLLRPGATRWAQHALSAFASGIDRNLTQRVIARVSHLRPARLQALGVGAFVYAALYAVEGIGLWKAKRWAEYLTVIATASFVPFEVRELVRQVSLPRALALALNLAMVAYLIYRLRHSTPRR